MIDDRDRITSIWMAELDKWALINALWYEGARYRRQPFKKGPVPRRIVRTKGGLNSKLHALCDAEGKPLFLLLTEGQASDYLGARAILAALPNADTLIVPSRDNSFGITLPGNGQRL